MQMVRIWCTVFELCVREKKKEERKNKIEISRSIFLTARRIDESQDIFYIRIAKVFHV